MSRQAQWVTITLILLVAAALRLWNLGTVPPGPSHDEVHNRRIARDLLAGNHAVYSPAGYGRETLYHYVMASTLTSLGDNWLGLRFPSVGFGLLGIAATYVLVRSLFDVSTALLTAAWLAVSFWPVFYSRVAWRAISLPFFAALSAYFLVRALDLRPNRTPRSSTGGTTRSGSHSGWTHWLLAGIVLGIAFYTYTSARVLPVVLVVFLFYLFLVFPAYRPVPWSRVLVFLLVAGLIATPLMIWLATHPSAEFRISEVREPLDRLLAGDPSLVWENLLANLKFFTFAGDPWHHQNYQGRPVFGNPIAAVLFVAGFAIVFLRFWRGPRYGFLLIWLLGALVPSIITSVAPSSVRNILGLVVVFVFPAVAMIDVGRWANRKMRWMGDRRRTGLPVQASCLLLPVIGVLILALVMGTTVRDYFGRWPSDDIVRFFYQTDLVAVARRLDDLPANTSVVVAGLSVQLMDRSSLDIIARREVDDIRLSDTREALVVPQSRDAWLFVPEFVPFDSDLKERLLRWGATEQNDSTSSYTAYRLPDNDALRLDLGNLNTAATLPDGTRVAFPASFGGQLEFLGYETPRVRYIPGDVLTLLTYWRVEEPPPGQLKIFLHVLGDSEVPLAQHDGLGSPPQGWAAGDIIVQKHLVQLPGDLPGRWYRLQIGVYEAATGIRLQVLTADRLLLGTIEVTD